jgi:hypothetical protein
MSRSNHDGRRLWGGNKGRWIESGHAGEVSFTPRWRRFAKRRTKREMRREAAKTIREAVALAAEEYQECLREQATEGPADFYDYLDGGDEWKRDWDEHTVFTDERPDDYYPEEDYYTEFDDYYDYTLPEPLPIITGRQLAEIPTKALESELIRRGARKPPDGSEDGGDFMNGDYE